MLSVSFCQFSFIHSTHKNTRLSIMHQRDQKSKKQKYFLQIKEINKSSSFLVFKICLSVMFYKCKILTNYITLYIFEDEVDDSMCGQKLRTKVSYNYKKKKPVINVFNRCRFVIDVVKLQLYVLLCFINYNNY